MSTDANGGKVVLVVEDDAIVRGAMQLVLEWEGYRVACAADGREALDYLEESGPPSLILLDLMMPVVDGWQFRREQQSNPAVADVPVVIVSALDASDAPPAAGHVRKPFQPEELLEVVRRQENKGLA
jgi:CheY-like chemotaxis protein